MRFSAGWLLLVWACAPEIGRDPVPHAIVARFDPTAQVVPIPTDLVRNAETGRLELPIDDSLSPAERELRTYLNTLDGYPPTTGAEVRFGLLRDPTVAAAIDPATITTETVHVVDVTGAPVMAMSQVSADGDRLTLVGDGGWPAQRTVLIAVRGGAAGVRGADGALVDADAAFHLLRGRAPLDQHPDLFPGATADEQLANATRLEEVRLAYQPYFELLEARGLPREEIAVLWAFTVQSPADYLVYDPLTQRIPFPNDLARENGLVSLPIAEGDSEDVQKIKEGLTGLDGFSTSAAVTFSATVPIDASTLSADSARLLEVKPDGSLVDVTKLVRELPTDGTLAALDPVDAQAPQDNRAPLRPATRYVVLVTDDVRGAAGEDLQQMPFTAILKFRSPLVEDGRSTLSIMDDATAARVEPLRAVIADAIERTGVDRDRLRLAFSFTTLAVQPRLRELDDEPWTRDVPLTIADVSMTPPALTPGVVKPMLNTAYLVTGTIPTFERIDKITREFPRDGSGHLLDVGFALCIPTTATRGTPMPVAVFGHGLTTAKELVYLLCDDLASIGIATIAIDFPYHGDRSICTEDAHCESGHTCDVAPGECKDAEGNVQPVREDFIIWSQNIPQPVSTGEGFVDLASLFASRDHVLQAVIDLAALVRSIRHANWGAALDGYVFDTDDISYLGISLGGILGSYFSATEPRVKAFALNVPGAGFVQLMQDSPSFNTDFYAALAERGIEPGTPEFFQFLTVARWIVDPADPMNVVAHAIREPYAYSDPETQTTQMSPVKKILVQMATPDEVVPNNATRILARMFGVPISQYTPVGKPGLGGHVFLFDPSEPEGVRAMTEIKTFLQARDQ